MTVHHFPSCRADYPEKIAGEPARHLQRIDIEDGEYVMQCVDCGALTLVAPDVEASILKITDVVSRRLADALRKFATLIKKVTP